jgi:hypothetical protein
VRRQWPAGISDNLSSGHRALLKAVVLRWRGRNDAQLWGAACFTDAIKKCGEKQISSKAAMLLAVRCDRRLANTLMREEGVALGMELARTLGDMRSFGSGCP